MPYCPECRTEYVDGTSSCEDCHVSLVRSFPEETLDPGVELVEIWRAPNEIEAQMVKALLDGNRIKCLLSGESLRLTHSIMVDGLAEVRILVREDDGKRSREIVEEYRRRKDNPQE